MKWKEKTTTSPSQKHLGIYRSLITTMQDINDSYQELQKTATQ
jgi:hypothetical protein